MPFDPGLSQKTLQKRVRFYPLFDCLKHNLSPDAEAFADERIDSMSNSQFLEALSFALEEMEEEKAQMSDPRITRLSTAIAEVLVCLVDIARDGERQTVTVDLSDETLVKAREERNRPTRVMDQLTDTETRVVGEEQPAKRRGRPPKADAATAETSASAAKTASELLTATGAGTLPTGDATTAEPEDTLATAQELTIKLVQAKGRETAVKALGDFNVAKASALAADQIGAYCEAVRELLSA